MSTDEKQPPREQWASTTDEHRTDFERARSPRGFQAGAWALWILGLAISIGAALTATATVQVPVLTDLAPLTVCVAVVADLACVLAAQRLWKKASALAGSSGSAGVTGVAMACLAFAPMALFFLAAKNAGTKTKVAAVAAALVQVALLVGLCVGIGALA